jgi:hypothetical protein
VSTVDDDFLLDMLTGKRDIGDELVHNSMEGGSLLRLNRVRVICIILFATAVLLLLSAATLFVLALLGVVADFWGLLGLLAVPVACVLLFVATASSIAPRDSRPSVMQMFGSGGR